MRGENESFDQTMIFFVAAVTCIVTSMFWYIGSNSKRSYQTKVTQTQSAIYRLSEKRVLKKIDDGVDLNYQYKNSLNHIYALQDQMRSNDKKYRKNHKEILDYYHEGKSET